MPTTAPLKISARKSDLARLQAYRVGQALKDAGYSDITYEFTTSLGDQNANDPLWQMPEKGVFTADLTKALIERSTDMVVHSWKDLPTELRSETVIAATLPRADARDLLLVKKSVVDGWARNIPPLRVINVLSSSPRRSHHLGEFLRWAIPLRPHEVNFESVRGNIQTRVRKFLEGEAHGLVVAKAAFDRLLSADEDEFQETRVFLRNALAQCYFVVLPLSECPGAAAQGALAVEVRRDRADLIEMLKKINCASTFNDVTAERATLRSYGGGCHQKIGVTYLTRAYGQARFLKGVTDGGVGLDRAEIIADKADHLEEPGARVPAEFVFPLQMADAKFYTRERLKADLSRLAAVPHFIWVSRDDALPEDAVLHPASIIWTAGLKTWRKLAERGIWVHGSADSLGEGERPQLESLLGVPIPQVKLAHSEAPEGEYERLATYQLRDCAVYPDLSGKTHFYWASSSAFERALRRYPEIAGGKHACGPGHTYKRIREVLGAKGKVRLYLSFKDWRDAVLLTE